MLSILFCSLHAATGRREATCIFIRPCYRDKCWITLFVISRYRKKKKKRIIFTGLVASRLKSLFSKSAAKSNRSSSKSLKFPFFSNSEGFPFIHVTRVVILRVNVQREMFYRITEKTIVFFREKYLSFFSRIIYFVRYIVMSLRFGNCPQTV